MRRKAPPPTAEDVLRAVARLVDVPGRTVQCGRGSMTLTGPSVTDISRHLGSYEVYVTPHLRALLAEGRVTEAKLGPFKVYHPAEPQAVAV